MYITAINFIMITLVELGIIFWVGAQLWRIFVISELPQEQEQQEIFQQMEQRFDRHFSCWLLLLILFASIGVLVGQIPTLTSDPWGQALIPFLVTQGYFGMYWIIRQTIIILALLLILFTMVIKEPSQRITSSIIWGNFVLGLALLVVLTLSGQAAATSSNLLIYAILGDFLHLLAAALWVGGMMYIVLIYLPVLKKRPWQQQTASLLTILPRYSPLAITGVVLMGLSGPLEAATRQFSWDQLFNTAYGRTLIVKVVLVGVLLLISLVEILLLRLRLGKDFQAYQVATEMTRSAEENNAASPIVNAEMPMKELEERTRQHTQRLSTILRWQAILGITVLLCTGLLTVFAGTLQPTTTTSLPVSPPQTAPSKPLTRTVKTVDKQFQIMVKIDPNHFGTNSYLFNGQVFHWPGVRRGTTILTGCTTNGARAVFASPSPLSRKTFGSALRMML